MTSRAKDLADPSRAFLSSLHPGGDPRTILSMDQLAGPGPTDRQGDVIVLAMTGAQYRDSTQREAIIDRALSALGREGVMWIGVPGPWRLSLMAALRAKGLAIGASTVHRRRGAAHNEFALSARGIRFALESGQVSRRWRFALALLERVPRSEALFLRFLPGVGFSAFRPGITPFGWLVNRLADSRKADVALATSWRGDRAPFLVFALSKRETLVAKRGGPECQGSIADEAELLRQLAGGAAKAGLAVPRLIDFNRTSRLCSLIETAVPGRPMAGWIRDGHHRNLGAIADRLAEWLSRWNSDTVRHVELTPALAESLIISPAREPANTFGGADYLDWILRETARLIGRKVPLVACHNDLTMANILGDRTGMVSVVDWEAASLDGLPLSDFHYAVCDAATAIGGGSRLAAFQDCFSDDGKHRQLLQPCETKLRAIAGDPAEWLELCFHTNWLRHADNERARSSPDLGDGFIAIAAVLAQRVRDQ